MTCKKSKKSNGFWKNIKRNKALLLLILPGFISLILFDFIPMSGLVLAFKEYNFAKGIWGSDWVGLDNIRFLFISGDTTWRLIRNTVGYFFLFMVVGTVCNVSLALALNECRHKFLAKYSQTIMIMPTFMSYIAVSFVLTGLLSNKGVVNDILVALGHERINFYVEPKHWPLILVLVNIWKETGYGSVLYLSALAGMDQEIFESARLDGATRWQCIRYLSIPMLSGMIAVLTILSLGGIMSSNTGLFYQVTRNSGALYPATQTLDTFVLDALSDGGSTFGITSAVTLLQSVVGSFMLVTVNLIVRKISPEHSLF